MPDSEEEKLLISKYQETKNEEDLAKLIEIFYPLIKHVALRAVNTVNGVIDREDIVQYGVIGFIAALNKYDPSLGVPFRAWCRKRIFGEAVDAVRRLSSTSRSRNIHMIQLTDVYAVEDDYDLVELGVSATSSSILKSILLELPLNQALIVLLRINGLPMKQIGRLVGERSEKKQRVLYNDTLEIIRKELAERLKKFL